MITQEIADFFGRVITERRYTGVVWHDLTGRITNESIDFFDAGGNAVITVDPSYQWVYLIHEHRYSTTAAEAMLVDLATNPKQYFY